MKNAAIILLSALALFATSCKRNCKLVNCTSKYVMLGILVVDSTDTPYELDEYYTIRKSTGATVHRDTVGMLFDRYIILEDNYTSELQNDEDDFEFVAIKDGKEVGRATMRIGADCCHISKRSGADKLVVQ